MESIDKLELNMDEGVGSDGISDMVSAYNLNVHDNNIKK